MVKRLETGNILVLEFRDNKLFYSATKFVEYIGGYPFYSEVQRGTRWLVEVTRYDPNSATLSVSVTNRSYIGAMPSYQDEIMDQINFIQFPFATIGRGQYHNTQSNRDHPQAILTTPSQEKSKPIVKKFSFEVSPDIENLVFQDGLVNFPIKDCKGYGPVELTIKDDRIKEAFGHIRPYIRKSLKRKTITIKAEIEVKADLTCTCQSANSSELETFLEHGLEKIRTDVLADQFFEGGVEDLGFKDVSTLTAVFEDLGGASLDAKTLITKLQARKQAKHALELDYLAERHREDRMKLHFLKEAVSFLFLLEGENRFHLVLEVFDKTFATYIWHCARNRESLDARIKEVVGDAAMLSIGNRQEYKGSNKGSDFKAINHSYGGDAKRSFEDWKREFEMECD